MLALPSPTREQTASQRSSSNRQAEGKRDHSGAEFRDVTDLLEPRQIRDDYSNEFLKCLEVRVVLGQFAK